VVTGRLLRSELTKVLTTRLWWGLLVGVVLYTGLQAAATAGFAGVDPGAGQAASPGLADDETIRSIYASATYTGAYIFAMVLGVTGMTGEYRYQTITPTFLATPRRARVVVAKAGAHLVVGVGYGVVAFLGAVLAGGIVILIRGADLGLATPGLWRAVLLAVLAVGLWTLLGLGIGTLIRNQVAAILVAIAVAFIIEPLAGLALSAADLDAVAKFLPSLASAAMTSPTSGFVDLLPWWGGGLVMLAYAALFAGIGVALTVRRDIT